MIRPVCARITHHTATPLSTPRPVPYIVNVVNSVVFVCLSDDVLKILFALIHICVISNSVFSFSYNNVTCTVIQIHILSSDNTLPTLNLTSVFVEIIFG